MRTHTARIARSTLFAGCFALLALSGCAPVDGAGDVSELSARDGNGLPVLDDRLGAPPPSALDPSSVLPDGVGAARPSLDLRAPSAIADGAIGSLPPAFDRDAFAAAVERAGSKHAPGVASLPGDPAANGKAAQDAVRGVVARSFDGDGSQVEGDVRECPADPIGCASMFSRHVAGFNGGLSLALDPLALRLVARASDLRVTAWTATRGGAVSDLAVTLHGRVNGRVVGVVVFR